MLADVALRQVLVSSLLVGHVCFRHDGTTDDARDASIMAVISGSSWSTHCLSSHVGIGSSSQDLQGALASLVYTGYF